MPESAPLASSLVDSVGYYIPVSCVSTAKSGMNYANLRHSDEMMSRSHGTKGGATDRGFRALQEQQPLWDRGAPVGLFNL